MRKYRDFSNIYDRIPAEEGEEVVPANAFGAYGDDETPGMADAADFGNVHFGHNQMGGEHEGMDNFSVGDFDDIMDSGAEPESVSSMDSQGLNPNRLRRRAGTTGYDRAPFSRDEEDFALTAIENSKEFFQQDVKEFSENNRKSIEAIQAYAMRSGNKIPSLVDMMSPSDRLAIAKRAVEKGAAQALAEKVQPRGGIPTVSARDAIRGATTAPGQVVKTAGNQLTASDIAQSTKAAPKKLDLTPIVITTKSGKTITIPKEKVVHPMLMIQAKASGAMGFDLGLDQLWADIQKSATDAIQSGITQLQTSAKQTLADTATKAASNLLQQPATQAAVQQAAQQVAVQTAVEKIMDPTTQAKIKKYLLYGAIGVGGLATYFIVRGISARRA